MRTLFVGLLTLCLQLATHSGSLPNLRIGETVGINIHFNRGHERDLDLIASAGIHVVRMDLGWAGIERKRGEYDWSAYDELTTNLLSRGLRPYYILDYSNPLYEETVRSKNPINGEEHQDTASPQHPESIAAFARWSAAAAARYADKNVIWEIWNEPNISFWKPKPDVQQYIALAKATCTAVRQADPTAVIVGPATSEVPQKFLEEFFGSGILALLDAVSVHPYRNYKKGPETAAEDYERIRELLSRHAPADKKRMPILSGEWGYSSHTKGVSPEIQACFLVRQQLFNHSQAIPVSIWYDWKNDGEDPSEREQNFGIVRNDLTPKPAFTALQTLTRQLREHRLAKMLQTSENTDYALLFFGPNLSSKLVVWTTAEPHDSYLQVANVKDGILTQVDGLGARSSLGCEQGKLHVNFKPLPAYIDLTGHGK